MSTEDIMKPRSDLGVKEVDDGLLILDRQNEKIHQLNATARLVWVGLKDGLEATAIAGQIAEGFEITAEAALADVNKVLEDFTALNLLDSEQPE
jgi:hypothetical protein